jgi:hypothetical protein
MQEGEGVDLTNSNTDSIEKPLTQKSSNSSNNHMAFLTRGLSTLLYTLQTMFIRTFGNCRKKNDEVNDEENPRTNNKSEIYQQKVSQHIKKDNMSQHMK